MQILFNKLFRETVFTLIITIADLIKIFWNSFNGFDVLFIMNIHIVIK
jgi:hypothetical protein